MELLPEALRGLSTNVRGGGSWFQALHLRRPIPSHLSNLRRNNTSLPLTLPSHYPAPGCVYFPAALTESQVAPFVYLLSVCLPTLPWNVRSGRQGPNLHQPT